MASTIAFLSTFDGCEEILFLISDFLVYPIRSRSDLDRAVWFRFCDQPRIVSFMDCIVGPISHWDISHITDLSNLFRNLTRRQRLQFNVSLEHWDVSNVTSMKALFFGMVRFNQPLSAWDVSNVTDMSKMFYHCDSFNQPLQEWNVARVRNMSSMFMECQSFNQPLQSWDLRQVFSVCKMFAGAFAMRHEVGSWEVLRNICDFHTIFTYDGTLAPLAEMPWIYQVRTFDSVLNRHKALLDCLQEENRIMQMLLEHPSPVGEKRSRDQVDHAKDLADTKQKIKQILQELGNRETLLR